MNEMPNGTGCVVASCGPLVDPVAPLAVNVFGCSRAALSLSLSLFLGAPWVAPWRTQRSIWRLLFGCSRAALSRSLSLSLSLGGSSSGALAAAPLFFYSRWVEGASVGLAHSHGLVGAAL